MIEFVLVKVHVSPKSLQKSLNRVLQKSVIRLDLFLISLVMPMCVP